MDTGPQKLTFADPRVALGSVFHSYPWPWRHGKAVRLLQVPAGADRCLELWLGKTNLVPF